jgi:hypothetical protein
MADAQSMRGETEQGRIAETSGADLHLEEEELVELIVLLDAAIADLSPEIADTDNARYRTMLRDRRELLRAIRGKLSGTSQ